MLLRVGEEGIVLTNQELKESMVKRRDLLHSLAAGIAFPWLRWSLADVANAADQFIRPKALRTGDTVGLITPATYVPDPDRLALAERMIKYFGLRMKLAKNAGKRMGDYHISINERLDDLHAMFR